MAALARSRRLREPQQGQIVYYFRRKRGRRPEYRGLAHIIAVEPPETGLTAGVSVVWSSHAGILVRAAPEHLRQATPLEVAVEEIVRGAAASPGVAVNQSASIAERSRYVDLGGVPKDAELVEAGGDDREWYDRPQEQPPGVSAT